MIFFRIYFGIPLQRTLNLRAYSITHFERLVVEFDKEFDCAPTGYIPDSGKSFEVVGDEYFRNYPDPKTSRCCVESIVLCSPH